MAFDSSAAGGTSGSMIGSALVGSQSWGVPAGFDTEGFLSAAKANFVTLQAAWDKSDINALRAMMTDTMLIEIQTQLAEREAHTGVPANQTDVVKIDAQLLGIEDLGEAYMASVEFNGMIREDPASAPNPFREVWNMTKPKNGQSGWAVAEVQRRRVSLLNHILQQEPEAQARLFRQKGRVVHVQWRFLAISLIATPAGLLDLAPPGARTDLSLVLTEASPLVLIQQLLSGDKPAVRVEGDVQLAAEVNWLADHVRWELEEDLARVVGDVPAHALAEGARNLHLALRQFLAPQASSRAHQAPT